MIYSPKEMQQLRTPVKLLVPKAETQTLGVYRAAYEDKGTIFCNWKTYGGTTAAGERAVDGIISVIDTATVTTWYRSDITSRCRLQRGNAVYEIIGEPENIEQQNRVLVFKVQRVKGGA